MKIIYNLLALISFGLVISAISSKQPSALEGSKVGDVKYSILNPSDFAKAHGEEAQNWVLLTGQKKNELDTKELGKYWQKDLPDARGMFIRGMNDERGEGADPDRTRGVGSPQEDAIKEHQHNIIANTGSINKDPNQRLTFKSPATADDITYNTGNNPGGKQETRPKNIALYLYIKVN